MSHRRRAMTLLELLVVIAIVAALAAMLMPLAGGAWSMACSLQCQMNLKHVYEAFVLFDADDMAKEVIGPSAFYPEVEFWPGIPYIACQESQIFTCPSTEASPWEFAGSAPGDPQTADVPGEWDGSPPPSPPPSSPPAAQSEALSEFLNDLRYLNRVRGFEVSFGDPGHQGLGHMNLATREGQDGRGNYIEIGLDDNAVVTAGYMDGDGHDGIIRIYKESDGRVVAQLVKYSCGEFNCVLYKNEPLFTGPADPPYVTNPGDKGYGHLGPGASKQSMEVELSRKEDEGGTAGAGAGTASNWKAMRRAMGLWAARLSSNYGMTRGAENFQRGVCKPLIMDFTRRIVDPTEPQFTDYLYRSARHSGQINVLFSDGSIESVDPFLLDPLIPGNERLYLP